MLYLFLGDDIKNKKINYQKFIASFSSNIEFFYLNRNDFSQDRIDVLCSGAGLFFKQCAVFLDNLLERPETRDIILEKLALMNKSQNHFIFYEVKINKSILDSFKKANADIRNFELSKQAREAYDNFLIANAFARRDKFNTWLYFRKAIEKSVSLEEITGVIFWKIKDMLLRKNFGKFKEEELKNTANRLAFILPETRKNGIDSESALERFLLEAC